MMTAKILTNALLWIWPPATKTCQGHTELGWLVIKGNKIVELGAASDSQPPLDKYQDAVIKDLGGDALILPGLNDAHIHLGYMGESMEYCQLADCKSIDDLQASLDAYSKKHPDTSWLVGVGWDHSSWGRYPTRQDLDAVESTRPVVLYRACWHIVVANTKALEKSELLAAMLQYRPSSASSSSSAAGNNKVPGGTIDLDTTGNNLPTGLLREAAVPLVISHISEADESIRIGHYIKAIQKCVENGITAVQTNDTNAWKIYSDLQKQGELPLRIFLTINHEEMEKNQAQGIGPTAGSCEGILSCSRVKLYSDGSLGAQTAALRQPYIGSDGNVGVLIHQPQELTSKITSGHAAGFQLEIHAIGDRAMETVLDSLDEAHVGAEARPVITHCQVMGMDLIERMASGGIIANIQPAFVGTDARWVQNRIEKEVQKTSYCWKTLMKKGICCAGGSDAPVEDCDPLMGLYDAIYRLPHAFKKQQQESAASSASWTEADVFLPEERLTFSEALWLYTIGAAYACHSENKLGRLEAGYSADFIVVDRDVSTCPQELLECDVLQVWVDGVQRFEKGCGTEMKEGEQTVLGGAYVQGKNGDLKAMTSIMMEGRNDSRRRGGEGAILTGKRQVRCCGTE